MSDDTEPRRNGAHGVARVVKARKPKAETKQDDGNVTEMDHAANIDPEELEELASLGCTMHEAACWFDYGEDAFRLRLRDPRLRHAWRRGKGRGRVRLRRAQFNLAEKNTTMAVLLGKRLLGQRDPGDLEQGVGITVVVDTGIDRGHDSER